MKSIKPNQYFSLGNIAVIFICSLFSIKPVLADDLRLTCKVLIEISYSEGNKRRSSSEIKVEVRENNSSKTIIIEPKILIMTSKRSANTISLKDESDENAWKISEIYFNAEKNLKLTSLVDINRNSGEINYSKLLESNDGARLEVGTGTCQKDTEITRKF